MHTIKIDISDSIYDNVMLFLNNLPKKDINLHAPKKAAKKETQEKLTDFFHASPLKDIVLEREKEIYHERVDF